MTQTNHSMEPGSDPNQAPGIPPGSWLHRLWRDKFLKIQAIKITILSILLILPFHSHKALAKKEGPTPQPEKVSVVANQAEKEKLQQEKPPKQKKEKKSKKGKKEESPEDLFSNHLTPESGRKLLHYAFEVPPGLRTAVDFWKMVYTKYDRTYEIFHDTEDLGIVYSILDFNDLYNNPALSDADRRSIRRSRIADEKSRILGILKRLSEGVASPKELSSGELAIYQLFGERNDPDSFLAAMQDGRLRSQTGIKNNFENGLKASGAYLEEMEDIFTSYGLPAELTRLAFVESMFNLQAVSKVGASGIWQFMPSTGRLYLNIDGIADERNDPVQASHAAAKLLKSNYEALGSWPLAINAYNSGRATMKNAVSSLGTSDIATIVQLYRGGVYGFASRNFYPCFLAALETANQYEKYFGKVKRDPALKTEYFVLKWPAYLSELASATNVSWTALQSMNPQLSDVILAGEKKVPGGYFIKIPKGSLEQFNRAEETLQTQAREP